jgi:hypothetical protein
MLGNEMARERVSDRLREAEADRRSRGFAVARASARRRRVRAALAAVRAALVPGSLRHAEHVGERHEVEPAG